MVNYYQSQARQNLDDAEDIAKENGTWEMISWEVSIARSTLESIDTGNDDDFMDVYHDSISLKNRA